MQTHIEPPPRPLFQQALALHQQDKLGEAEQLYQQVLEVQPNHFDATHLLGVIALQTGRHGKAVELIEKAIQLNPNLAEVHSNLGNALTKLERFDEALAQYDRAIALKPNLPEAHNNRGSALKNLKRFDEAVAAYQKSVALRPDYAEAYSNLGNAYVELKRYDEAFASYRRSLELKPDYAEAYSNIGNALTELKRFDEAVVSYCVAISLLPNLPEPYNNLGTAFKNLTRYKEALESYDKAILLRPNYAEAHRNRGVVLAEMNDFSEALASLERARALMPRDAETFYNRGIVLTGLKRLDEALDSYDTAIALKPDYAEAHNNRGIVLADLKRFDEALSCYAKALELKADWAEVHCNMSFCLLLNGRFDEGWPVYEWRKKKPELAGLFTAHAYAQPLWDGQKDIAGKTLFIYWEQAFGDTIQFIRYVKWVKAQGANIIVSVPNRLRRLLSTLDPPVNMIPENEAPPGFDYHSPLMSLPLVSETRLGNIPAETPYLRAEPERVRTWKQRLGAEGFKIGIAWQGSTGKIDIGRSFALREFLPLSRIPNVRLISLQKGDGSEQMHSLPDGMRVESLGEDYDAGHDAFLDAAAVMENLDLIISSDTAVAHLAGALARPVWVALKAVPDWRWLLDRSDSPWYPGMRLFRQNTSGDWTGVFSEMAAELTGVIAAKQQRAR